MLGDYLRMKITPSASPAAKKTLVGQFLLEAIVALNACYSTKNIGVQVVICPALTLPPFSFVVLSFNVECVSTSTFFQYLFIYLF